jgi:hypothetical protein
MMAHSVVPMQVEFGLHQIEGNPNLTFIVFLGASLLAVLGLRFSYYAQQNLERSDIESQADIWRSLRYIGVTAAAYATLWILEITTSLTFTAKNGLLLAVTLLLVVSLQRIQGVTGTDGGLLPFDRRISLVFVGAILAYVVAVIVLGESDLTALIESLSAIALLGYGVAFFRQQVANVRLQGTMLDSLVRHLVPVLAFSALVSVVAIAIPLGLDRVVVLHVQVVFLIMTATTLMTATIKLQQNLAGLRG